MSLGCRQIKILGSVVKILVLLLAVLPTTLMAGTFPAVCPTELASWIKANKDLALIDIQSKEDYRSHNYANSHETHNDQLLLKKVAAQLRKKQNRVIVVSATGGPEAVQAAERLTQGGVFRSRIMVLEGGMQAAAKNAACECCKPTSLAGASK